MVRTRVGYAGGAKRNPTYHDLGDHTESIQIDFDPAKITYEKLLEVFWSEHDPSAPSGSCQYKTILFHHDDEQKKVALASRDRTAAKLGAEVRTEIRPYVEFWPAEDYHQKYRLRNERSVMREFSAIYPDAKDFMNSTAAARVNAYLDGQAPAAQLEKELPALGLSESAGQRLQALVKSGER